jgi:glucose 1-dehydrogenase
MRSITADYDCRRLLERDIAEPPSPRPGEVLLRIAAVGVCGTDRDLASFTLGEPPVGESFLVIGHEALAQVMECGSGVGGLSPGDWVVPTVRRSCPSLCPQCAAGRRDLCLTLRYSERGIFRAHGYFTEYAVDESGDLVPIPAALAEHGFLIEPLSVVEKAVSRALHLVQSQGRRALVLGLGPIGMLAAATLALRGFDVTVFSAEPPGHPRAALLAIQNIRYTNALGTGTADVIIEAAGSGELALAALKLLAPCGAMVVLGARNVIGSVPFIDLLVKNQTVAGIVNASRADFDAAVADLPRIPASVRSGMIERFRFNDFRSTLSGVAGAAPKAVHVVWD